MEELKNKSVQELKSIAYDLISELERVNHQLNVVNQLIFDKQNEKDKTNETAA